MPCDLGQVSWLSAVSFFFNIGVILWLLLIFEQLAQDLQMVTPFVIGTNCSQKQVSWMRGSQSLGPAGPLALPETLTATEPVSPAASGMHWEM